MCFRGPRNAAAVAVTAGVLGLLQGAAWAVLGLLGYLLCSCQLHVAPGQNVGYVLYVAFFYNPECGALPPPLQNATAVPSDRARTTAVLSVCYLAAGAAWAALSLPLLVVSVRRVSGACCLVSSYLWALAAAACLTLDALATTAYGFHIDDKSSIVGQLDEDTQQLVDTLLPICTALVMLVTSRLVLLWLVDAALVALVVAGARRLRDGFEDDKVMSTGPPPTRDGQPPPPQYVGYDPGAPPLHPQDPRVAAMKKDGRLMPEVQLRRGPASSASDEELYHARPFTYTPQQQPQALQQRRPHTAVEKPPRADKQKPRRDKDKQPRGKENVQLRPEELPGYSILPLKQGFDPAEERPPPEDGVLRSGTARRDFRRRLEHQLEQPRRMSPSPNAVTLEDYARREEGRSGGHRLPPSQLRSLLPWSYLAPPEELPRRAARADGLELPPVPVPDYTLHFGPRARDRLPSASPASSVSGHAEEHAHANGGRRKEVLY